MWRKAPQQDQFRIISLCFELFCILARNLCYCNFILSSLFSVYLYLSWLLLLHYVVLFTLHYSTSHRYYFYIALHFYRVLHCYRIVFLWKGFWCNGCEFCAGCCSISFLRFLYCATLIYFFPVLLPAFCKVKKFGKLLSLKSFPCAVSLNVYYLWNVLLNFYCCFVLFVVMKFRQIKLKKVSVLIFLSGLHPRLLPYFRPFN